MISYRHPPAKEHSKPLILAVTERLFVSYTPDGALNFSVSFLKINLGAVSEVINGTPKENSALIVVASTTVMVSASIPAKVAVASKSARIRSVPVKMISYPEIEEDATAGKVADSNYSYVHKEVSELTHSKELVPDFMTSKVD